MISKRQRVTEDRKSCRGKVYREEECDESTMLDTARINEHKLQNNQQNKTLATSEQ